MATLLTLNREFTYRDEFPEKKLRQFLSHIRIDPKTNCWIWNGWRYPTGYGGFNLNGQCLQAHRVAYLAFVGELPQGKHLHHKTDSITRCVGPECCNPWHVEPVDPGHHAKALTPNNITAIKSAQVYCKNGHELSGDNLYPNPRGKRICKACAQQRGRDAYLERVGGQRYRDRTHCKHGHEMTESNTYWVTKKGTKIRQCRECKLRSQRAFDAKNRGALGAA